MSAVRFWKRKQPLVMAPRDDRPWYVVVDRKPGLVLIETEPSPGEKYRTWVTSYVTADDVSA